jgi:hypothetical protein
MGGVCTMTNLEVAQCWVFNAIAYGKHDDSMTKEELLFRLKTVNSNLDLIQSLLENPEEENQEHDWEDFK